MFNKSSKIANRTSKQPVPYTDSPEISRINLTVESLSTPISHSVKSPPTLNRGNILELQRTLGNRAVTRLIEQKRINQVNTSQSNLLKPGTSETIVQRVIILENGEKVNVSASDSENPLWSDLTETEMDCLSIIQWDDGIFSVEEAKKQARKMARAAPENTDDSIVEEKKDKVKKVTKSVREKRKAEREKKPKKKTKNAAQKIVITQFGGQRGSTAGDAAIIGLPDSRRLHKVDFGTGSQSERADYVVQNKKQAIKEIDSDNSEWETDDEKGKKKATKPKSGKGAPKFSSTVTHSHADHAGQPNKRSQLYGLFNTFNVGKSVPDEIPPEKRVEMTNANSTMFGYRQKKAVEGTQLSITGQAIIPEHDSDEKDANKMSLGGLIKVHATQEKVNKRVFTFLTLGDMYPSTGRKQVEAALTADTGQPPDLVKLPHHGSENNLAVVPPEAIGKKTRIIISGYTMTDTTQLAKFITDNQLEVENEEEPRVFFLFSEQQYADELTKVAAFAKLKQNVKILKDYTIKIHQDGTVEHVQLPL